MLRAPTFLRFSFILALALATPAAAAPFGPLPPANPATALGGAATMHADSASSDSTPWPGPGIGRLTATFAELGAACPTVLQGSDATPVALCTSIPTRAPEVVLLDPASGLPTSIMTLPKGALFGGVYTYLDRRDRMVLVDATGNLIRVGHRDGTLAVEDSLPVKAAFDRLCKNL